MVETLVAVAILMISIAGPLTIANKGLTAAIYAKDQVIASFLAQDAMEYVKNMRDNNANTDISNWLTAPKDLFSCTNTSKCTIDTTNISNPIASIGSSACTERLCVLYDDFQNKKYTMNSASPGVKSKFNRSFYISSVSSDEATVIVEVTWINGSVNNKVTLQSEIFKILR